MAPSITTTIIINEQLYAACEVGNLLQVQCLVREHGADVNYQRYKGGSVHDPWPDNNNNNITSAGDEGWTPLMIAVRKGRTEIVEYLVEEEGADINIQGNDGFTAFHGACFISKNSARFTRYLLDHGAALNAKDEQGWTAFHYACHFGRSEAAEILMKKGANVVQNDFDGNTPLHLACMGCRNKRRDDVMCMLLRQGKVRVSCRNKKGETPMDLIKGTGCSWVQLSVEVRNLWDRVKDEEKREKEKSAVKKGEDSDETRPYTKRKRDLMLRTRKYLEEQQCKFTQIMKSVENEVRDREARLMTKKDRRDQYKEEKVKTLQKAINDKEQQIVHLLSRKQEHIRRLADFQAKTECVSTHESRESQGDPQYIRISQSRSSEDFRVPPPLALDS